MRLVTVLLATLIQAAAAVEQADLRFTKPLGIDLLSLQLDAVPMHFGDAPTTSKAGYQSQKCYLWPNVQVTYSGYKSFWMGFEMTKRIDKPEKDCVDVRPAVASIVLDVGGLHLGMTEEEFAATVGVALDRKDGWFVANVEWSNAVEVPSPGSGVMTVISDVRIEAKFIDHRLATLRIIYGSAT